MTDIMDTANIKPKKNTTMFEVNDTGREFETSGDSYKASFVSFIESLDYEVESDHFNFSINGVPFGLNLDNASYYAKSAYDRRGHARKPENRYISLRKNWYKAPTVAKVHFNKDIDADKLRSKIDAGIAAHHEREKELSDAELQREQYTVDVAKHYLAHTTIALLLQQVRVEQGRIAFFTHDWCSVEINADGTLLSAHLNIAEMKTQADVIAVNNTLPDKGTTLVHLVSLILNAPLLPAHLQEWSKEQYHRHFYVDTMSTKAHY